MNEPDFGIHSGLWNFNLVWLYHYDDVIMTTIASQITSLTVVNSIVYSDADERKHQSSASLAFVWGINRDRWIPRTKGQLRGKCFHLMTSSCGKLLWKLPLFNSSVCCHRWSGFGGIGKNNRFSEGGLQGHPICDNSHCAELLYEKLNICEFRTQSQCFTWHFNTWQNIAAVAKIG